ncbi:MAG: radical SAM protein [Gammaproteobacteria bacterium]|nr:radical SAM protein [Gammaproteobacteria bacterium]
MEPTTLAFGPVPSRRLGRSLGINNIPPKSCTYSCVYCQVGRTEHKEVQPREFFAPEVVLHTVQMHVNMLQRAGENIDYLTFVPDGEPTLDIHLGETIQKLQALGIKIAVISNGSLIWREDVQHALNLADWVSLKVDSVTEPVWRAINRPHPDIRLSTVLDGMRRFAAQYKGLLNTETMLVAGLNDKPESVAAVADFVNELQPDKAYLSLPTRPPAESDINAPEEDVINQAFQIMGNKVESVEYLLGYEEGGFASTGDAEHDLLSITSVHPMREPEVAQLLKKTHQDWSLIERLLGEEKLKQVDYSGQRFYVRRIKSVE